jgi:hypothetical protein
MRRYTGKKPGGVRRCVFGVVSFVILLGILGVIGGIEHGTIAFKTGAILCVLGCAAFADCVFLAGALTAGGDR